MPGSKSSAERRATGDVRGNTTRSRRFRQGRYAGTGWTSTREAVVVRMFLMRLAPRTKKPDPQRDGFMARGATLLRRRLATLSERYNGRDPAGTTFASPRRLCAEFGPRSPPVSHHHRLALVAPGLTAAPLRLFEAKFIGKTTSLSIDVPTIASQSFRPRSPYPAPHAPVQLYTASLPSERRI